MNKSANLPIPAAKALRKIGSYIKDAHRRRRITISLIADGKIQMYINQINS